jgi:hypothetical protein
VDDGVVSIGSGSNCPARLELKVLRGGMYEPEGLEFEYTVTKYRYDYRVARVRNSEFGVRGSGVGRSFTEVKRDGGFLDVGFSSCTAPTFCRSLDISDGGSGFRGRGSEYERSEVESNS